MNQAEKMIWAAAFVAKIREDIAFAIRYSVEHDEKQSSCRAAEEAWGAVDAARKALPRVVEAFGDDEVDGVASMLKEMLYP